jgi:hypothetical protein
MVHFMISSNASTISMDFVLVKPFSSATALMMRALVRVSALGRNRNEF